MRITDKVRIGSFDYNVVSSEKTLVIDGKQCKGLIDYHYHTINIDNSVIDKQSQEVTFLHEILHGIVDYRNVNLENIDEETIIEELARGLHALIRDNPEIFK